MIESINYWKTSKSLVQSGGQVESFHHIIQWTNHIYVQLVDIFIHEDDFCPMDKFKSNRSWSWNDSCINIY